VEMVDLKQRLQRKRWQQLTIRICNYIASLIFNKKIELLGSIFYFKEILFVVKENLYVALRYCEQ
ncbi:hypothetical protein, partial [Acinetobacter baumannii]